LLNGPPGGGKSTLARLYADQHPLTLNLDIDRIRDMLGQWRSFAGEAGLLARAITLAAARTHLAAGFDVVIPQFVGRMTFLTQAESLAGEAGADFREVVPLHPLTPSLARRVSSSTGGTADASGRPGARTHGPTDAPGAVAHRPRKNVGRGPQPPVAQGGGRGPGPVKRYKTAYRAAVRRGIASSGALPRACQLRKRHDPP